MNHRWRRIMTTLGLLSCLAMVSTACVVRAQGAVRVRPAAAVYVVDEPPPPPRYRVVQPRAGHVWIRGYWERRGSQWFWVEGRWETERTGYVFNEGHWEQRGNRWHWVEGRWVVDAGGSGRHHHEPDHVTEPPRRVRVDNDYPTAPPPAPRVVTRPAGRSGYLWVEGRWQWRNGNWDWVDGHWERERSGFVWRPGRWERQGDRYTWIEGSWEQQAGGNIVVRDRRDEPPRHGRGPTAPPPAPRAENPQGRAGYVWVAGRWNWVNDNWDWVPGHWERARGGFVWQPGRWELQGGIYVWVEGQWVEDKGGPAVRDRRRPGGERPNTVVPTERGND